MIKRFFRDDAPQPWQVFYLARDPEGYFRQSVQVVVAPSGREAMARVATGQRKSVAQNADPYLGDLPEGTLLQPEQLSPSEWLEEAD